MRFPRFVPFFVCLTLNTFSLFAQSPNGNINGLVSDPSSAAVVGAEIVAVNEVTGVQYTTKTNSEGLYVLPNLPPGPYRIQVSKVGFKTLIKPDITLNVQDSLSINFTLLVGAFHEIVTVEGGAPLVNTESAAVSTVVDQQFAENLPMNGRSFQTLIELTPGVVPIASNALDGGQFSVNGQRGNSNYWMVDGVAANIGVAPSSNAGNGFAGTLGSFSALGGTNSLVSVDALQEFRIQTSTYAPEFGRSPGAQISIVTRSGTNQFHGTLFDYLRNDVLDANNWFADSADLAKPKERQNDFGGTLSGPILKDRTFFFFSYEGLRLRLPETLLTTVPDVAARQGALPVTRSFLDAFPLPNGTDNPASGIGQFNASYSDPGSLDAYSLRLDHRVKNSINLFGRYNYSPSSIALRGGSGNQTLSDVHLFNITTQTATTGATWTITPTVANDLRFNYSKTSGTGSWKLDNFGGATPLTLLPFPTPFTAADAQFDLTIYSLTPPQYIVGKDARNVQRQFNIVDNLESQKGAHHFKFGVDYRRLSPVFSPLQYSQLTFFNQVASVETGDLDSGANVSSGIGAIFLFRNLGVFAQDTWRALPRMTLTYGLRWELDFVPSSSSGPELPAAIGFNANDFSALALAPVGTPPFSTTYGNVAPRIGIAYELSPSQKWGTVLRSGFGVFYDLEDSEVGNVLADLTYPYGATNYISSGTFPLDAANAAVPAISSNFLQTTQILTAFNPHLQLPYTLQWNIAIEQSLGGQQSISASYLGAAGRRLLQTAFVFGPNANLCCAQLITNEATSDYNALQIQFHKRLSRGLQALVSYTWSHSIDTASAGSAFGNLSNALVAGLNPNENRGPSDFDIRNALTAAVTYDIPAPTVNHFTTAMMRGWSIENAIQARSAPPINVYNADLGQLVSSNTNVRPDTVAGQPFYLYAPQYPGGKALNPAAFTNPPLDPNTGVPLRQGDLGRNALRGFGASQWDFAVHRDFPIHERLKVQFRAEMFNILNHPNFAQPVPNLSSSQFGLSTETLAQSLGANVGNGGFLPLYQLGGPRSIQIALKLIF